MPLAVRPDLPPMADSCREADLPPLRRDESVKVFALKNRKAAIEANGNVRQCQAFYGDVRRDFGNSGTR